MAALPPALQVAGPHLPTYEALFQAADSNNAGAVGAQEAAMFLKRSGLSEAILSQIWEMSDPSGKGMLDKDGFFVALKLIALQQNGQEVSMSNVNAQVPPPSMTLGAVTSPPGPGSGHASSAGSPDGSWTIAAEEKTKYDAIFDGLQPVNGLLPGDKVRPVLLNSKLPVDILGRVWDLADIDSDGLLDREEFAVAMHLVYQALEKNPVPIKLPSGLVPPSKRRKLSMLSGGVPVLPGAGVPSSSDSPSGISSPLRKSSMSQSGVTGWIISPQEQASYDEMFKKADLDMDGFVNGIEIKDIFLQSGVAQPVLAHIWNLCDIKGIGKLNNEQFGLAMYLVQQKIKGIEPPQTLTTDLIPPSMRLRPDLPTLEAGAGSVDTSSMAELDMIAKEIEELKGEKMQLEADRTQKEADIKIRNGEMAALQKELDAINSTLKQLENQRNEAQKRLDDLDDKKSKLENMAEELKEKCKEEEKMIETLKSDLENQEVTMKNQEEDLTRMRDELTVLRSEEAELEQKVETSRTQVDQLARTLNDTQQQIAQSKARIQHLGDMESTIKASIQQYDALINGEDGAMEPSYATLALINDIDKVSTKATAGSSPISTVSGWSANQSMDEPSRGEDPFKGKDPFAAANGEAAADPFKEEDPFKSAAPSEDPFKGSDPFGQESSFGADPFAGNDPFSDPFAGQSGAASGSKDAFGARGSSNTGSAAFGSSGFDAFGQKEPEKPKFDDPFDAAFSGYSSTTTARNDPFGDGGLANINAQWDMKSPADKGDPFGTDPFAPATTKTHGKGRAPPRPGPSPTPALPPKQKKAPPPRPPAPGGKRDALSPSNDDPFASGGAADPFSSKGGGGGGFADFADWSPSKFSTPASTAPSAPSLTPSSGGFGVSSGFGVGSGFGVSGGRGRDDLAWATVESQRAEEDRQARLRRQEEEDLKMAIELSKADMTSSSEA